MWELVELLGMGLMGLGGLMALGAIIWVIVVAFTEGGVVWGLVCLLFTPAIVLYVILNFDDAEDPFLLFLGGLGVAFVGFALPFGLAFIWP
jgi:hypothetical protein